MLPGATLDAARDLLAALEARRLTRGYVTYSNEAKAEMLGVPAELFGTVGAVSEEVARAMAEGAVRASGADLALSCTGIAGPGGATPDKPVGLVFIGCALRGAPARVARRVFPGDRAAVRAATVAEAFAQASSMVPGA
jgi:nicotinamide-nucleotide amidase